MDIRLPQVAEGADSGTVVKVLVNAGDLVALNQDLIEVETQKAVVSIPSPAAGQVLRVHVKEGDTVKVGQLLLSLSGEAGAEAPVGKEPETAPPPLPAAAAPASPGPPPSAPSQVPAAAHGSPAFPVVNPDPVAPPGLRKEARNLGIDLTRVRGTGRGGRIVLEDVRNYVAALQALAQRPPMVAAAAPTPASPPAPPKTPPVDFARWGPVSRQALSPLRRTVSQRMHASWSAIPHVTQLDNADITDLMALRKKRAPELEKAGARLTLTPFILRALAVTLRKHPRFNSSLDPDGEYLVLKDYVHIGIAVDTEAGLMVPVIRDVDKKDLLELAQETERLAEKARSRKISPDELQGGSFTVSNQGALGGAHFTPIVNHPEVAILGLGRASVMPLWLDGKVVPRQILPLALSYDHRVVDGADAVRFVRDLVTLLEQPEAGPSISKPERSGKKGR
jgi:pyruvate dehydrogenase E2 component (dihydrolipoamide acetyltransferase)